MSKLSRLLKNALAYWLAGSTALMPVAQAYAQTTEYHVAYPGLVASSGGTTGGDTGSGGDTGTGGTATASFSVSTASIGFGSKHVSGSSASQNVTLTNTGTEVLTGVGYSVAGTAFSANSGNCSTSLAVGASCVASVLFTPTNSGSFVGSLTFSTVEGGSHNVALSGTGTLVSISASAQNEEFGSVNVGSTSAVHTLTFTNTGNEAAAVIGLSVISGQSDFGANGCLTSLPAGGSCSVTLSFTPSVAGSRQGTVVLDVAGFGPVDVGLSGEGMQAVMVVTPTSLDFGVLAPNATSVSRAFTIANTGNTALTGVAINTQGTGFAVESDCSGTVAAHSSCSASLSFTPPVTEGASISGTAQVVTANGGSSQVIVLSGATQNASVSVTPPTLDLGNSNLQVTSAVKTITVTNNSTFATTVASAGIATGAANFAASNNCGSSLAPRGTCTIDVTMTPTTPGSLIGSVGVVVAGTTQTTTLSGTGTQGSASVSPSLNFAPQQIGSTSAAQTATVTNNGAGTLTIASVNADSPYFAVSSNTCGAVAPGATCSFNVTYTPTVAGPVSATVTFVQDGLGASSVAVTGSGVVASASLSPVAFDTTQVGQEATGFSTLTNTGIGALRVTAPSVASVTGTDFTFSSTQCGGSLAVGESCTTTVRFIPSAEALRSGSLSISTGAGSATATLTGNGKSATGTLSAPVFADTLVGSTSTNTAAAVLTNSGIAPISVTAPATGSISGTDFSVASTDCGTSLAAGANCSIVLTFSPTSSGSRTASLNVTTGAGAKTVSIGGTGTQGVLSFQVGGAAVTGLTFGAQQTATQSPAQTVTLKNTGTGALTLNIPLSGVIAGGSDFGATPGGACTTLAVGATCLLNVSFTPASSTPTSRPGTYAVMHNGVGGVSDLSLTGTVQAPSATLSTPAFANTPVGVPVQATAVLRNTGLASISVVIPSSSSVAGTNFSFVGTDCSASLGAGLPCNVTVSYIATTFGTQTGTLTVSTGAGSSLVTLSATGNQATATPSATTLGYADTAVGSSTVAQTLTITNSGNIALSFTSAPSVTTGTSFSITATTCSTGTPVAANNGSCTVSVKFNPTARGASADQLTWSSNGTGAASVALSGTGLQAQADVSPASGLTFASTQTGSSAASQTVTVTNPGNVPLVFNAAPSVGSNANYAVSSNTCTSVPANNGGNCTFVVTFTPTTTAASLPGSVSLNTNGVGASAVALAGSSQAPSAALTSATFANALVGTTVGNTLQATLSNTGSGTISVTPPVVGVIAGTDFRVVSTDCTSTLAKQTSCLIAMSFSPSATGSRTASLSIVTGAGTQQVTVSGTGIQGIAGVTPASPLAFGTQASGTSSATQTVTVTNSGTAPLTFTSAPSAGTAQYTVSANTCTTVAAPGTCTFKVAFTPSSTGSLPDVISFAHNGTGATSIAVTGTGQAAVPVAGALSTRYLFAAGSNRTATLTGTGFTSGATVTVGATAPVATVVTGSTSLTFAVPTGLAAGNYDVKVTNTAGSSTLTGALTVMPALALNTTASFAQWSGAAGTQIGISASTSFITSLATTVSFGGVLGTATSYPSAGTLYSTAPAHALGRVDVVVSVTDAYGNVSVATLGSPNGFTYLDWTLTGPTGNDATPTFVSIPRSSSTTIVETVKNYTASAITMTVPSAASMTGSNTEVTFLSTTCTATLAANSSCLVKFNFTASSRNGLGYNTLTVTTSLGSKTQLIGGDGNG